MKKRNIKNLQLNKKSISNMQTSATKGGFGSSLDNCDTDITSCYWLVCPFSDPIVTICEQM
ncbi:hypothetical protein [Kordia sp.]|uniref:hypothetical protein n=1 Tax=Kordia sp. TaxID=1965332 RepID=UPI003B5BF973